MENDDALIGTIWTRREAIRRGFGAVLAGAVASRLIGCAPSTNGFIGPVRASLPVSPALTEGPFFVDEKLNRSNLLAGTTRTAVNEGAPLQLKLNVLCLDAAGNAAPFTGAQVDVWHCDTSGIYSDEDDPMNAEVTAGQRWLRGYQLVDANGMATFSTIVPGWYNGRTPHIHFKVRQFKSAKNQTGEFTSQFFFPDAMLDSIYAAAPYDRQGKRNMLNTDDGIFSEQLKDGTLAGSHQLLLLQRDQAGGFQTHFTIVVSDASLHDKSHDGPGGPGGPPGGGPHGGPRHGPPPDDGLGPPPF